MTRVMIFTISNFRNCAAFLLILISCLPFSSCKKPNALEPIEQPEIFKTGVGLGNKVSGEIGVSGGELVSHDGLFKIKIPAGSFSNSVTVGIEAISNTNPGGIGTAYRVSPISLKINSAFTVEYRIEDFAPDEETSELLTIAAQDVSGSWRTGNSLVLDKGAKCISISSMAFGDFSAMRLMELISERNNLEVNQQTRIKLVTYVKLQGDESFSAPFLQNKFVCSPKQFPATTRLEWELDGVGTLAPMSAGATLYAPDHFDNPSEAKVKVLLKNIHHNPRSIILRIPYTESEYLLMSINSGPWVSFHGATIYEVANQRLSIMGKKQPTDNFVPVILGWKNTLEKISWGNGTTDEQASFQYGQDSGLSMKQLYTSPQGALKISSGGLQVQRSSQTSGEFSGNFELQNAGRFGPNGQAQGTSSIKGVFRLKLKR